MPDVTPIITRHEFEALAARLAEVEGERDRLAVLAADLDAALTREHEFEKRHIAEIVAMRPVVEAAKAWRETFVLPIANGQWPGLGPSTRALIAAVDALQEAPANPPPSTLPPEQVSDGREAPADPPWLEEAIEAAARTLFNGENEAGVAWWAEGVLTPHAKREWQLIAERVIRAALPLITRGALGDAAAAEPDVPAAHTNCDCFDAGVEAMREAVLAARQVTS